MPQATKTADEIEVLGRKEPGFVLILIFKAEKAIKYKKCECIQRKCL